MKHHAMTFRDLYDGSEFKWSPNGSICVIVSISKGPRSALLEWKNKGGNMSETLTVLPEDKFY